MEKEESLNKGAVVEFIPKEMYEKAARDFSEGNPELEKLLLYCFNHEIKTIACCAGNHVGEKAHDKPYIVFDYNKNSMDVILKIIKRLLDINDLSLEFEKNRFIVRSSGFDASKMFNSIREACESQGRVTLDELPLTEQAIIKSLEKIGDELIIRSFWENEERYQYSTKNKEYINQLLQGVNLQYYNAETNLGEMPSLNVSWISGKEMRCAVEDLSMIQMGYKNQITYNPFYECKSVYSAYDDKLYEGGAMLIASKDMNLEQFLDSAMMIKKYDKAIIQYDGMTFELKKEDNLDKIINSYNQALEEKIRLGNKYEFNRKDGVKINLRSLGSIDERYGDDSGDIEKLTKYNLSFTMPNGKVIDNLEIVGQIDDKLLNNKDYLEFITEYYLDPKRIQNYICNKGVNYIGYVEECPKYPENPEGFMKKYTPEIMTRYETRKKRGRQLNGIDESQSKEYSFITQDGTRVELTDINSFYSSENGTSPLHEYHAKITRPNGAVREGTLYGRIDMTKMQEKMGTEYNINARAYREFVEKEYLEPSRLIVAMFKDGGYIGRVADDGQIPTGVDYKENEYENYKGKNSILRDVSLTAEGMELEEKRKKKREWDKSQARIELDDFNFDDSRYYEYSRTNSNQEPVQSTVETKENVVQEIDLLKQQMVMQGKNAGRNFVETVHSLYWDIKAQEGKMDDWREQFGLEPKSEYGTGRLITMIKDVESGISRVIASLENDSDPNVMVNNQKKLVEVNMVVVDCYESRGEYAEELKREFSKDFYGKIHELIKDSKVDDLNDRIEATKNEKVSIIGKILGQEKVKQARVRNLELQKQLVISESEPQREEYSLEESLADLYAYSQKSLDGNFTSDMESLLVTLDKTPELKSQIDYDKVQRLVEEKMQQNKVVAELPEVTGKKWLGKYRDEKAMIDIQNSELEQQLQDNKLAERNNREFGKGRNMQVFKSLLVDLKKCKK